MNDTRNQLPCPKVLVHVSSKILHPMKVWRSKLIEGWVSSITQSSNYLPIWRWLIMEGWVMMTKICVDMMTLNKVWMKYWIYLDLFLLPHYYPGKVFPILPQTFWWLNCFVLGLCSMFCFLFLISSPFLQYHCSSLHPCWKKPRTRKYKWLVWLIWFVA